MEKGPPPPEMPAPPYPGPPLSAYPGQPGPSVGAYPAQPGPSVGVYQSQPTIQTVYQPPNHPSLQPRVAVYQPPNQASLQPANHVVVVQQLPTDCPGQMMCPHCQTSVVTRIEYKVGACTWLICGLIGLFLCWPCCFIPFCVDSCKDVEHYCPACNNVLHIYKRR